MLQSGRIGAKMVTCSANRVKEQMEPNPIDEFHRVRKFVFSTYEKLGYDKAVELLNSMKVPATARAGLKGELIFYEKFGKKMKLEPLLDAGVKADFTGEIDNHLVNFDVTTNINYKDIDEYAEVSQKRNKLYHIIQVNPKTEEIQFFPLRFPLCPICHKFSHYILYLVPSESEVLSLTGMSDEQRVVRYCPNCGEYQELNAYYYVIQSIASSREMINESMEIDDSQRYSPKEIDAMIEETSISTVKFFEKESTLLISALAENGYIITNPKHADGYTCGVVHWKHPLASSLSTKIDYYYDP